MSNAKLDPLNPVERNVAYALLRFLDEVMEPKDVRPFITRIVAEGEPEPDRRYICEMCCQKTDGDDGRFIDPGVFVCKWCMEREAENNAGGR